MAGFFSKLFGGGKKKTSQETGSGQTPVEVVEDLMKGLLDRTGLDLSFKVRSETSDGEEQVTIEISGPDEALLKDDGGALLDSIQLFLKRVVQHRLPEDRVNIGIDSNGFREESSKSLIDLADKLRDKCLEQGRSVYLRPLSPKERKIVHQHLGKDDRVRSRSVGEGLYKKIKIYPARTSRRDGIDDVRDDVIDDANVSDRS